MIYDGEQNEDAFYGCGIIQRRLLGHLMRTTWKCSQWIEIRDFDIGML